MVAKPARPCRRPNYRLIKIHRSYMVEEIARLFGVHKNTVRNWLRRGLPLIDDQRPQLVHGVDLVEFLRAKRDDRKRPCGPGTIYCVRCRAPREPALGLVDFIPVSATAGNLRGICPDCETLIHRRVSRARLHEVRGRLEIADPQAQRHIGESPMPSENCDS